MLESYFRLVKEKDKSLDIHSENVALLSLLIGDNFDLNNSELKILYYSGYFHDLGKLAVSKKVLLKKEKLSDDEFKLIKKHPIFSEKMLPDYDKYKIIKKIVRAHHERIDGRGYPDGLNGDDIPFYSRIIAVADSFDAMTTDRKYQKVKSNYEAVSELLRVANSQLDEKIVNAFFEICNLYDFDKNTIIEESREKVLQKIK